MTRHPLDPLDPDEVRAAVRALRREHGVGEGWRVGSVGLREPAKARLAAWAPPAVLPREAEAIVWCRADGATYEAVIDLDADAVRSWTRREGVQPSFTNDEYKETDAYLRGHPDVLAALAARGIADVGLVLFDLWAYGAAVVPEGLGDRRVGWCDVWLRKEPGANPYATFLDGLHPIVDVNAMELVALEDSGGVPGRPATMGEYVPRLVPGLEQRDDVRPLAVTQPEGPSFALDGNVLRWQRWSMHVGFTSREGLVLGLVAYEDGGRERRIAHRLSFAEMVVPYRDPTPDHYRRTAFDVGEWGLGFMTTSLELGCDCLGEIRYLDATLHDTRGEPYTIRNAICIHEEDNAVLWKHVDAAAGAEVRRMRRLVVSFHATVANYEYLVYWRFHQDGNIECEVRATGIMVTTGLPDGGRSPHGTTVDARTYAPHHQHFIVARLDLDVDGAANTVVETGSRPAPIDAANPHGLALIQDATPIRSERESARDYDWASQRAWKVVNPDVRNAHGDPVAYKLVPGAAFPPLLDPSSPVLRRAAVIGHQLWVTAQADDERWPAGDYPTQALDDTGLPAWIEADRPLEGADVVLWYVFGIHHLTRPEEWPVMAADAVSFWLKPAGFFDRNPALDVPPEPGRHCHA